jgi:hypothetical protein
MLIAADNKTAATTLKYLLRHILRLLFFDWFVFKHAASRPRGATVFGFEGRYAAQADKQVKIRRNPNCI